MDDKSIKNSKENTVMMTTTATPPVALAEVLLSSTHTLVMRVCRVSFLTTVNSSRRLWKVLSFESCNENNKTKWKKKIKDAKLCEICFRKAWLRPYYVQCFLLQSHSRQETNLYLSAILHCLLQFPKNFVKYPRKDRSMLLTLGIWMIGSVSAEHSSWCRTVQNEPCVLLFKLKYSTFTCILGCIFLCKGSFVFFMWVKKLNSTFVRKEFGIKYSEITITRNAMARNNGLIRNQIVGPIYFHYI